MHVKSSGCTASNQVHSALAGHVRALAWDMLNVRRMTNTEFIARGKHRDHDPLCKAEGIHFGVWDGALVVGFLAAFMGLVFLLSK